MRYMTVRQHLCLLLVLLLAAAHLSAPPSLSAWQRGRGRAHRQRANRR